MERKKRKSSLKVLRSGDPRSQFVNLNANPKEILERIGRPRFLLSSSSKIRKGESIGVLTRVLYLTSGLFCPAASKGCLASCLGHSSGFMKEQRATNARDRRSALFIDDRDAFIQMLRMEIHEHRYNAETQGMTPAIRLNGTADLAWEELHPELFEEFSDVVFYDYTKLINRMEQYLVGDPLNLSDVDWPKNYHLTFSLSERNAHHAQRLLNLGGNVAAVFWPELPKSYPVINGDKSDARFLDDEPCVVGLTAKGFVAQKSDQSGFVLRTDEVAEEEAFSYELAI